MSEVPSDLKYTRDHEWLRLEDDAVVTIGITDHAQAQLGDLVFVEVPETGSSLGAGDAAAVVESVKAASDVYAPVAGEVVGANEQLDESPELVNNDPFGEGWIYKLRVENPDALDELMSAADYEAFAESEED
ncbi:glycine cleavage system protein GcvH [Halofilum ochraceum]|jgi:glycine cleavage system H protein|uniref:glycine cleavage system protein GcvH n=1 Tax=Halofilum ochraceum TaxID=1611323 RepID=UPI000832540D|nr:glycine cleavage system protein GcvH [Halofilum ochraceum]